MSDLAGARGARELVEWITGAEASTRIDLRPGAGGPMRSVVLTRPVAPQTSPTGPVQETLPAGSAVQDSESVPGGPAPAETLLDRHVLSFAPCPRRPGRPAPPALPAGVLLLTNLAQLPADLPVPGATTIVTVTAQAMTVRRDGGQPEPIDEDRLAELVAGARPGHVRVLVGNGDPALRTAAWSDAARAVLRLHEAAFLTARANADRLDEDCSFLVTLLGALDDAGRPRPFTGLFTGLVKSLALEFPAASIVATLHGSGSAAQALELAAGELGAPQLLPVVAYPDGRRATVHAATQPVPAGSSRAAAAPLRESSVVVAAGGGRGIGVPILTALARRYRPRIVVLGTTPIDTTAVDGHPPELPNVSAQEAAAQRASYIKNLVTGPQAIPVREANARFERLQQARSVREALAELERLCGQGRVTYLRCDLQDTAAVRAAFEWVRDSHGDIDLLLNIAGTNRAAGIRAKSRQDFRHVRDLKLHSYVNLKEALREHPPRRWCNFGSFVGFTGQIGETDYASANDFLNSAAMCGGPGEFTIGWTLWRDIGLGATPIMRTFLAKSDQFTATPTEEGVAHFLAELANPEPDPATVFFGAKERAAIAAAVPGYLEFCQRAPAAVTPAATPAATLARPPTSQPMPFIDRVVRDGEHELTAERTFDLDRDGFLELHQVHGYPTLPGTFVPELAAEAACALVPHRVPVVFEDLRLESFLRVYRKGRSAAKRIHARLVESDEQESVVAVRVLGDLVAPTGHVLAADRLHFSVTVRLRDTPTPSPRWEHWEDWAGQGERPLIDPYHVEGSAVLLREVFESTTETRLHPLGRRARLNLNRAAVERWFPGLLVPSVLLDGLVRVAVLDAVDGRWTPVAIPRYMRRIDLYGAHTDAALAADRTPVELYVTPLDLDLESPEPDNRAIAVTADGEVILQVKDIVGAIVGYVDQRSGRFVDRAQFDSARPDRRRQRKPATSQTNGDLS